MIMICMCSHNMSIVNLDDFDMDWALEVQKDAQIEANTTFGNLKGVDFLGVENKNQTNEEVKNPGMVDGNDRNYMEDMEDMEHQDED